MRSNSIRLSHGLTGAAVAAFPLAHARCPGVQMASYPDFVDGIFPMSGDGCARTGGFLNELKRELKA